MNVLIVGHGKGSWEMRGVQLGAALGARATTAPTAADWDWAECVVLVKRAPPHWATHAHARGLPVVWDAIDFWRQPSENPLTELEARILLRDTQDVIRPTLTIGATGAMADAAGGAYLPHHGHAGLAPTDAREVCRVVGYEGNPAYLDTWAPALRSACLERGWAFVVNPSDLSRCDILVALRGGVWDGWMCREWKSGVKVVNAILAGRPLIYQPTAATRELAPLGTAIATTRHLSAVLALWAPHDRRQEVVDVSRGRAAALSVQAVATDYARLLANLKKGHPS